jgi:hypothetical protein
MTLTRLGRGATNSPRLRPRLRPQQVRSWSPSQRGTLGDVARRVVPNPIATYGWATLMCAMAGVFVFFIGFGTFDGGPAEALVLKVVFGCFAMFSLTMAVGVWSRGSAVVDDDRVRSGWPRSHWIGRDEIAQVEGRRNPLGSPMITAVLHDGSRRLLIIVPNGLTSVLVENRIRDAVEAVLAAAEPSTHTDPIS